KLDSPPWRVVPAAHRPCAAVASGRCDAHSPICWRWLWGTCTVERSAPGRPCGPKRSRYGEGGKVAAAVTTVHSRCCRGWRTGSRGFCQLDAAAAEFVDTEKFLSVAEQLVGRSSLGNVAR